MATQAFKDWVADGRPFRLARPVAQYSIALTAAGWGPGDLGTIGNEEHAQAETPEDHMPYSFTGWPLPNEYPYVHAIDVMHHPDRGLDVGPLVAYWVAEARAGRTPWMKYINWSGLQWDVRRGWAGRTISGHFDHAHVSFRTDWTHQSIGGWTVVKKGTPMTSTPVGRDVWGQSIESPAIGKTMDAADWIKYAYSAWESAERAVAALDGLRAAVAALADTAGSPVNPGALADALAASEGFVDRLAAAIVGHTAPDSLEVRVAGARELLRALGQAD